MNKAFEEILKRIDKLQNNLLSQTEVDINLQVGIINGTMYSRKIVQEIAEKYNNGWIACSERLPEEYNVLCCDKHGEMIIGHPYFDEINNPYYIAESDNEIMYNCVAWQPLPEPFKESD